MNILIALDESPVDDIILNSVTSRQWPKDTNFFVLHVVESSADWFSTFDYEGSPFRRVALSARQARMQELSLQLQKALRGFAVQHKVVVGEVTEQILQAAQNVLADLIILGRPGPATHESKFDGVAERVVQRSTCSVEVIKPTTHNSFTASKKPYSHEGRK